MAKVARWVEAQRTVWLMQLNNFSYSRLLYSFPASLRHRYLFVCMYVHEYGTPGEKSPNEKSVRFILRLDKLYATKRFRTPTYHEIMLGYVEDAKVKGLILFIFGHAHLHAPVIRIF